MAEFDVIASTVRAGVAVDEVEIQTPNAPPTTAYLLGRRNDGPQPLAIALHHARGDKASLLGDLEHLAARGFLCLGIDSPVTRRASADRDPLQAFTSQQAIAQAALAVATSTASVHPDRVALVGRGIGGEVAARIAATSTQVRVVVAMASLPDRSQFIDESPHPLAAGLRQFNDNDEVERQIAALRQNRLIDQLEATEQTNWLLQVPQDDDRISDADRATLALSIPRTVRVDYVERAQDLSSLAARRIRVDFVSNLCG